MLEKGIPKPIQNDFSALTIGAWEWITRVWNNFPSVQTFEQTLTPSAVSATAESVQTFTVTGLTTLDTVIVNKPTHQVGLSIVESQVSAADTLKITYYNFSGSPITPTSEDYKITAVRL